MRKSIVKNALKTKSAVIIAVIMSVLFISGCGKSSSVSSNDVLDTSEVSTQEETTIDTHPFDITMTFTGDINIAQLNDDGVGDPVFEKLDANLAKAIMSIGAVKGFEIGDGFAAADSTGSTNNDSFTIKDGKVVKKTNHSGGVLGGMSDGSDIIIRAAVKPTPSIARTQETVSKSGEDIEVSIKGRHDPMIVPRAVVVVEAMTAVTLVDMIFANMTSRIDRITEFYKRD